MRLYTMLTHRRQQSVGDRARENKSKLPVIFGCQLTQVREY